VCRHAEAVCRLRGEAFPAVINELLDEGRQAGERPGTLADAYARIDETVALLDGLAADALDMDADKPIAHELANGMIFDLTADQYARDWTLAQFYFHVMTARYSRAARHKFGSRIRPIQAWGTPGPSNSEVAWA